VSDEQTRSLPAKNTLDLRCFSFFTMEALDQRSEHSLPLIGLTREPSKIVIAEQLGIVSKKYVILGFASRPTSYLQETTNLII